jgi:hypothetical protein
MKRKKIERKKGVGEEGNRKKRFKPSMNKNEATFPLLKVSIACCSVLAIVPFVF